MRRASLRLGPLARVDRRAQPENTALWRAGPSLRFVRAIALAAPHAQQYNHDMTDELTSRTVVLVVEDEPDHLMMLQFALESFGYEVIATSSLAAGRAALAARHVDVLVADFFLGDGTAVGLLDGIGDRRPRFAVVMSGLDGDDDIDRSLAAGYDAHLVKPTSLDTLRDVIVAGLRRQGSGIRFAKGAARAAQPQAAVPPLTKGNANR